MKSVLKLISVGALALTLVACTGTNDTPTTSDTTGVVEPFSAEYTVTGTTSGGVAKVDTFIFEGETTDGIITSLNFDIIRNKGQEDEYSKKDLYGYMMNVADLSIEQGENGNLVMSLSAYGYDASVGEGSAAQYMVGATSDNLTEETTFGDLTLADIGYGLISDEEALYTCFSYVAKEAGVDELTSETAVKDIISAFGLYSEGDGYSTGSNRISFAGYNGGRSYGEQIDAIVDYILANNMTLEDVYEMFRTVNQPSTDILDRDVISGATISFVGDFQRMAYVAAYGELFEGVTNSSESDGLTTVEVVTQGYGGEIETHVTFDSEGNIASITVRDDQETDTVGGLLTAEGSDFLNALVEGQDNLDGVDVVSGATVTSNALKSAVDYAIEYINQ